MYAGIQTSGLFDVVNKTNIWYNVVPYEVNVVFPCRVSSKKTYANQLENRRNKADRACRGEEREHRSNREGLRLMISWRKDARS